MSEYTEADKRHRVTVVARQLEAVDIAACGRLLELRESDIDAAHAEAIDLAKRHWPRVTL